VAIRAFPRTTRLEKIHLPTKFPDLDTKGVLVTRLDMRKKLLLLCHSLDELGPTESAVSGGRVRLLAVGFHGVLIRASKVALATTVVAVLYRIIEIDNIAPKKRYNHFLCKERVGLSSNDLA
jgi:hypothetical protein